MGDLLALWIKLARLGQRISSGTNQAQSSLTLSQFDPEKEMAGIHFDGLLQQLQCEGKLFIVIANA